jgi:hypothetical protein
MTPEAVFALAAAAIAEHGDEKAFDEVQEQINQHLEANDMRGAGAWTLAALMIDAMLTSLPH